MAWPKAQFNNLTLQIVARIISASRKEPKQKILSEFNSGSEVKISMRTFEQYSKNLVSGEEP